MVWLGQYPLSSVAIFNSKIVSYLDLNRYQLGLQNIGKELKVFKDNINDILVDLKDDDPRKDDL